MCCSRLQPMGWQWMHWMELERSSAIFSEVGKLHLVSKFLSTKSIRVDWAEQLSNSEEARANKNEQRRFKKSEFDQIRNSILRYVLFIITEDPLCHSKSINLLHFYFEKWRLFHHRKLNIPLVEDCDNFRSLVKMCPVN